MRYLLVLSFIMIMISCEKEDLACSNADFFEDIPARNFDMGFTTWTYDIGDEAFENTYDFILANGDIYAEQIDEYVPWRSLTSNETLPDDFVLKMNVKAAQKPSDVKLSLSVSLLNTDRDALLPDLDGFLPENSGFDDPLIINAYEKHLDYLIGKFDPDYLIFTMEVNDLFIKDQEKWEAYKRFSVEIRSRLKSNYPSLPLSESITLHSWFEPETSDADAYDAEMKSFLEGLDFAAISFYAFLKGLKEKDDFQRAFDFLHNRVSQPIAFVETNHIAETLELQSFNLTIESDECEQNEFLEVLLENAQLQDYLFTIWWAHRDYDELWKIFPDEVKDIGKIWRDTGLLDEEGSKRIAFETWQKAFAK